jgi:hypothetical protein
MSHRGTRGAGLAAPAGTPAVGKERGDPSFSITYRLVDKLEATLQEDLVEVSPC